MNHTLLHLIGIAIIGAIGVLCNWYVSRRIIKPIYGKAGLRGYRIFHLALLLILGTLACIANFGGLNNSIALLVWVMYGFMLFYIPKLCYVIISSIDYLRRPRGTWAGHIGFVVAAICAVALIYGAFNRYNIQIKETTITSQRIPSTFDNYRIVQFSDLHLETMYSRRYVQRLVDSINAQQPDVILFTGDMVNRKASELLQYNDILSQLKAADGVYTVMGNHDYGDFVKWESEAAHEANLAQLRTLVSDMGWHLLDNASTYIYRDNDSIAIIGVENWGEPPFQQYGDLAQAYPSLQDDTYKILLSHNSRHWRAEVLPHSNIDLTLSGHTHAMQLTICGFSPAIARYPEWGGFYKEGNQYLYVNIGVGCTMYPARIGATPEITVITLQSTR